MSPWCAFLVRLRFYAQFLVSINLLLHSFGHGTAAQQTTTAVGAAVSKDPQAVAIVQNALVTRTVNMGIGARQRADGTIQNLELQNTLAQTAHSEMRMRTNVM